MAVMAPPKAGFPYVLNTIYWKGEKGYAVRVANLTYVAVVEIVEDVVCHYINAVHFFVVENRVRVLSFELWDAVDHLRLVLEDVGDEDILA